MNDNKIKLGFEAVDTNKDGFKILTTNTNFSVDTTNDLFSVSILNTLLRLGTSAISTGKDGFYVGNTNSYISVNTTDDKINLASTGIINLSNTNNVLKMDVGSNSYLHLNMTTPTDNPTNFLQIGETGASDTLYYNTTDGLVCKIGSSATTGTFTVGNTDNYLSYTNANGIILKSRKVIDIANDNSALYFDPVSSGDNSYLKLNKGTTYYNQQMGKCSDSIDTAGYSGAFFGKADDMSTYIKYKESTSKFEIKVEELDIQQTEENEGVEKITNGDFSSGSKLW
jgi:hypothetical protein